MEAVNEYTHRHNQEVAVQQPKGHTRPTEAFCLAYAVLAHTRFPV